MPATGLHPLAGRPYNSVTWELSTASIFMTVILLSLLAITAYGLGTATHVRLYLGQWQLQPSFTFLLGLVAAALHLVSNSLLISTAQGWEFSFFKSASAITNIIVIVLLLFMRRKPVQNLFLINYPLAILSLIGAVFFTKQVSPIPRHELGILLHVSLSIIAYSFLSVAALQALLLYIQNKQLKARKNSHFLKALPPLLTMETILFALIRAGFVLLTLAIVSGAIFIQDLFAQHLVHKTALSLFAWLVFAILLIGHHFYGWRGLIASRWTLGGAIVLMLGFLGSKLVLEIILST